MTNTKRSEWCLIASGPSLTSEQIRAVPEHVTTIVINDSYRMAPNADYLYACDRRWWDRWNTNTASFQGEKWTQDKRSADEYGLSYIRSIPAPGISESPNLIHQGSHSGFQALNLAVIWGATKIVLLGYDMSSINGAHWFGEHYDLPNTKPAGFSKFIDAHRGAVPQLKRLGIEVINATPNTALDCYERLCIDRVWG